jgi:peptidoglycan/xylan/chitin deacetylase (PgdA/CDA1 family)
MPARTRSRTITIGIILTALVLLTGALSLPNLVHNAAAGPAPTVYVSLTWDDGRASQFSSVAIQQAHAMPATYYINSGLIGGSRYYMTKAQLDSVVAGSGNEIGGHSQLHENLTKVTLVEAQTNICNDRSQLVSWYGDPAGRSFAYPYGATNTQVEQAVKDCGYTSGRSVTGVASASACLSCLAAETLPPADPYRLAVPTSVSSNTTLDDLKFQVEAASASGGGWVVYTMHDIGVNGSLWNIDPTLYSQFLDWLASRSDVQVRTVGDLMGQTWPTPTNTNTEPQAPPVLTPMALPNAGLEASTNGRTDCWLRGSSGTNTAIWSRTPDAHTGTAAEQVTITALTSGDRKLVSALDAGTAAGGCAPSVDDAHSYHLSAWYRSTAPVNLVVFTRDSAGAWKYWRTAPSSPAASSWSMVSWDTPLPPTGTTALSFGVLISSVGTLIADDYSLASISPARPAIVDPAVVNSSLEADANADGLADCWSLGGYGVSNATFTRVADAHSGFWGEKLVVSSLISGDRKLVPTLDNGRANGGCAPSATAGTRYQLGAWYRSDTTVQLIAYYRDSVGTWHWWFSSTYGPSNVNWTHALKLTPPTPVGITAISFGIGLPGVGTIITDDYSATPV